MLLLSKSIKLKCTIAASVAIELRLVQKRQLLSFVLNLQVGLNDLCVEESVTQIWKHTHTSGMP